MREASTMGDKSSSKEPQLELPSAVFERLPPRAAERRSAQQNVYNSRRAVAALRAAAVQLHDILCLFQTSGIYAGPG